MLTYEQRIAAIKTAAIRIQTEKKRQYELEQEMKRELFGNDDDIMSIENLDGITIGAVQKVQGGVRYIPVIID